MEGVKDNILHINNNMGFGGTEKVICQICAATRTMFHRVGVASSGGVHVDELKELGVVHYAIPDLSSKDPRDMCKIWYRIRRIIKEQKIQIIHCHHRMAVFYAKLCFFRGTIIYNHHTILLDKPRRTHWLLKDILVIADGEQARRNLTDHFGVPESRITVIDNGVESYDGHAAQIEEIKREKEKGRYIVIAPARLHPQKGLPYFIEAAKLLLEKGYVMTFFIIGDGPLKGELQSQVREEHLEERIIFMGSRKDIKNVILQSDLLVMTSLYEGLPLTPMEAFSVKRTVVATDIEGTREVVTDHYDGLLAKPGDAEDIADKIEIFYKDRQRCRQYGENGFKTYQTRFSIERFEDAYQHYYMDCRTCTGKRAR